jgi:molybdopterin synthase catalytic subunit/molybdopterin converting factor small subunit
MHVRVRLFAMQRELVGAREVDLEIAPGASIEDAWQGLVARYPILAPGRAAIRFARNADYVPADTILVEGDELAMIPPVSGGAAHAESADGVQIIELREAPFEPDILAILTRALQAPEDGAVCAFLGVTRSSPGTPAPGQEAEAERHAGRRVDALEYEAHPVMAKRVMATIGREIEERFGVVRLAIVHRIGDVPLGEASVAIVACAPHRDAAFDAVRYAIDETKARAPIWKAEQFADGQVWIGEPARTEPVEG